MPQPPFGGAVGCHPAGAALAVEPAVPPPVTIDHVLADGRCGVRDVREVDVPGSDHRAVVAELVLPRGRP